MPVAAYLKQEADLTVHEGMATEERLAHLGAALKECIQQISSLQEERESEVNLKEANKKLICSLVCKQELVDELERDKQQLEAELDALVTRFESVEKENAFLKCECCALERELVLSLESSNKVAKLEEENKSLREIIKARENELCSSKLKCAQAAYKLAVMEVDPKDVVDDSVSVEIDDSEQEGVSKNSLLNHFMKDGSENELELVFKDIVPVDSSEGSRRTKGGWPWNVLDVILEEHHESKRSINELLEEIQVSLVTPQSCSEAESDLNRSICRMIELIEEISPSLLVGSLTNLDYSVHVFRWRNSELIPILRKFVLSCSLVLNGSQGLKEFARQLTSILEFAVENCITLEDASRVRDRVRKHFNIDRSKRESELDCENVMTKMIKIQTDLQEQNKLLKLKLRSMELANKELEKKLSLADENNEQLMSQLEEYKERIGRLEEEVEDVNESKGIMEDQIEHHKSINEDLDTQLTVAKARQNEMMQRLSSMEVELEDKNQCCEELETTCLELQLQLEIISRKGSPYVEQEQMGNCKQIGWEMITDCSKLALVIQETCKESDLSDNCDNEKVKSQRYSLRDRMLADNDDVDGAKTKERDSMGETEKAGSEKDANKVLAVVPMKKQGGGGFGFIRKMFLRRRKSGTKNGSATLLQRNASTMMR